MAHLIGAAIAHPSTQGTIRSGAPDWQPWVVYFLRALQKQKQRLEAKIQRERIILENRRPFRFIFWSSPKNMAA
jgi:hypothetical protein